MHKYIRYLCVLCACAVSTGVYPAVLPEDRADVLYHAYDGGGVEITGPSIMILKKFGQNVAVTGNYYADSVSSASIDVESTASPYDEQRHEVSAGIDYLHGNSIMSLSYTNSNESDYEANTASFGISMDMFANMTTVSMGYAHGWDTVGQNGNPTFSEEVRRHNYRLGLSQVITKKMLMEFNFEGITDEGFLNNPYRVVRYDAGGGTTGTQSEVYPRTRTSAAFAVRSKYYMPWPAAVSGEYRYYTDTWEIDANTIRIAYTHPFSDGLTLEASYRFYSQSAAEFYSDLFPFMNAQNFLARDKELSTFQSHTIGAKASLDLISKGWQGIDRASINLSVNAIRFDYDDFRDARVTGVTPGTEPLYGFTAGVVQVYLSAWF